jgi:hypothetical protein
MEWIDIKSFGQNLILNLSKEDSVNFYFLDDKG